MLSGAMLFRSSLSAQNVVGMEHLKNKKDWLVQKKKILAAMQKVMGTLPEKKNLPLKIERFKNEELPNFTRTKITYQSDDGDAVPAYLLIPKNLKRPAPAMLCLHQTTKIGKDEPAGLGGKPSLQYAKELAERGYVAIVPDYPYLGENNFDPYQNNYASCTMKGIVNHRRAIDVLQSLPMVDKKKIGSIGHSLGGHNTLFVAAFEPRIKVMVSSCGFTKASKYYQGDLTGWSGIRYMPLIATKFDKDPKKIPFDFPDLLIALAPRPLFINAPLHDGNFDVSGVRDCVDIVLPIYENIFRAKENLLVKYPDTGHEFPDEIRGQAYDFLDNFLFN